jgi:hypothetical protein
MIRKASICIGVITMLVFLFACTNEPLINGFINNKAQAITTYPTTTTTTATATPTPTTFTSPTSNPCTTDPCAAGCPNANTCTCNPVLCAPSPTPTATPNKCGSDGDSECSGKIPGDSCTISNYDDGSVINPPIDGACSSSCKCEFCETCNSCFGSVDEADFIGSYDDSTTSNYNPGSTYAYRKMFNANSTIEQIGSDLKNLKERKRNKAYRKKAKFVRSYKENNDGTISVLVKSKAKENGVLTQKDSWLKFKVGDACSKTNKVRGKDVPTGECNDPGPCKAPCEKCIRRNPTSTTDKCCFCKLNPNGPGGTAAQCSPDHDTPVVAGDSNSCAVLKGDNHKCDNATCKCKCGNDDPCDALCEKCDGSVAPNKCALKKGSTCGSAAFGCNGAFTCNKTGAGCFCGCNVDADCTAGPNHGCCKLGDEAVKHCHECCKDGDCPGATPKCCATNNKGQRGVCGSLNVDGCVPIAP